MDLYNRLQGKIKEKGETIKSTEEKCGLANATIQKWKKQSPRIDTLLKVTTFLNISIDWLIIGEESEEQNEGSMKDNEKELIDNYRKLTEKDQKEINEIIIIKLKNNGEEEME